MTSRIKKLEKSLSTMFNTNKAVSKMFMLFRFIACVNVIQWSPPKGRGLSPSLDLL